MSFTEVSLVKLFSVKSFAALEKNSMEEKLILWIMQSAKS